MAADRDYVSRQSLTLDAWILLKTIFVVLSCRGAY
jgi:lipopolysaccharide/colanic/teichoic acid biosynthesis glycosyltransferase